MGLYHGGLHAFREGPSAGSGPEPRRPVGTVDDRSIVLLFEERMTRLEVEVEGLKRALRQDRAVTALAATAGSGLPLKATSHQRQHQHEPPAALQQPKPAPASVPRRRSDVARGAAPKSGAKPAAKAAAAVLPKPPRPTRAVPKPRPPPPPPSVAPRVSRPAKAPAAAATKRPRASVSSTKVRGRAQRGGRARVCV
jgi:hypothetical protein